MSEDQIINKNIFNTELIVNIIVHVVILFTILSFFFKLFIAKVSSDAINHEVKKAVEDSLSSLYKQKDTIKSKINNLVISYNDFKNELVTLSENSQERPLILNKMNDILLQINNLHIISEILPIDSINNFLPTITMDDVTNYIKKAPIPFDYYLNLFSKENLTRKRVNDSVFSLINITNFLLVLFSIIIIGVLFFINALSFDVLKHILLENVLTFIFVGIIEIIFFLNIALKFIPAPPSLIFTSLIDNLKLNIQV